MKTPRRLRNRLDLLLISIVLTGGSRTEFAQDIRAVSEELHQFNSPMIFEMSLDPLLERPFGEKWSTDRTKVFICRGVTIESLEFRVQTERKHSYPIVEVFARLNNNSGKDKRATILFEGIDDNKSICSAAIQTKVEQGDTERYRTLLYLVPPERWNLKPRPKIRVTLTLVDY